MVHLPPSHEENESHVKYPKIIKILLFTIYFISCRGKKLYISS